MLASVVVNVADPAGLGTVSGLAVGSNKVEKNAMYTVTANADTGADFLGWYNGSKLLTTNATYTAQATANIDLTPKFAENNGANITVSFVDKWGNTVKEFKGAVDEVQSALDAELASVVAPNVAGYEFTGWDMDDVAIKALDHSQTIRATYAAATGNYTVTTNGGATFADGTSEMTGVAFDTKVTVTLEGAQGWAINGVTVATGDTYSFYVGSDVTVTPVMGAVTVAPTTSIVSTDKDASSVVVNFLATRNVPDGYTLVSSGFVYGKTAVQDELTLDKASVAYCSVGKNGSAQFLLPYGLSSASGTIGVRSFVTVKDAHGAVSTVYSDIATYTY